MLQAADALPMNLGFLGKGNASRPEALVEQIRAGCLGPQAARGLGDDAGGDRLLPGRRRGARRPGGDPHRHPQRVGLRRGHAGRVQGARDPHAITPRAPAAATRPTSSRCAACPHVLPSSTNPTRPYTVNTVDEHLDMLMVCHHLDPSIAEDVAFAESRIRRETIAAEDILHDLGAISMMSSDSQAMGRVGEVITRTWQTAHKMKQQRGPLPQDATAGGAQRQLPRQALPGQVHDQPGDHPRHRARGRLDRGRQAGRPGAVEAGVLRRQAGDDHQGRLHRRRADGRSQRVDPDAAAGALPADVRRAGRRAARDVGDVRVARGAGGRRSGAAAAGASARSRSPGRARCASATSIHNGALPVIEVDAQTYEVRADGELLTCAPATTLPLAQRYFLF